MSKKWKVASGIIASIALVAAIVGGIIVVGGNHAHAASTSNVHSGAIRVSSTSGIYSDYSLINQRSAGQYWSGQWSGQWAWNPQSNSTSHISWGDPKSWPPASYEVYFHQGNWVMIDGWGDNTYYYSQRVSQEWIGDANCNNLVSIPSSGHRQHYVQWAIPTQAYCLDAKGTITQENATTRKSIGITIQFEHRQIWSPPAPCSNQYYQNQTCIAQHESWSDNNGHPFKLTLDRTVQLAHGLGMAFTINQTVPSPWHADLRYNWNW